MNYEFSILKVAFEREQSLRVGSAEHSNFNEVNFQFPYSAISTNICAVTTRRNIVSGYTVE